MKLNIYIFLVLLMLLSPSGTSADVPSEEIFENFDHEQTVFANYETRGINSVHIHDGNLYIEDNNGLQNDTLYSIDYISTNIHQDVFGIDAGIAVYSDEYNHVTMGVRPMFDGNHTIFIIGESANESFYYELSESFDRNWFLEINVTASGMVLFSANGWLFNTFVQLETLPYTFGVGRMYYDRTPDFGLYEETYMENFTVNTSYKNVVVVTETETVTQTEREFVINETTFTETLIYNNTIQYNETSWLEPAVNPSINGGEIDTTTAGVIALASLVNVLLWRRR